MSFSVGIVGLPNVGKSTLFKALTKQQVEIAPRPFTTIHPNRGIVSVPDERLKKIAEIVQPEKITPTVIEFIDIAGLVKEAHKGAGLGNQFLAQIRNCDAICEIVRIFKDDSIEHIENSLDPRRDIDIIKTELLMKDLETLERTLAKMEGKSPTFEKSGEQKKVVLLKKIKENVGQEKEISEIVLNTEEKKLVKEFQFLTEKPVLYIINIGRKNVDFDSKQLPILKINLKLEEEILELSEEEIKELGMASFLYRLILSCYQILDLITFYTIAGGKEVRAWTIKKGSEIIQAAEQVHSDFARKFIRAEVINWEKLFKLGTWKNSKEAGALKIVGKDYIVQDGDVIEFKI